MKNVAVSELKARLGAYLTEVRCGETVIVYDGQEPVARLIPYEVDRDGFTIDAPTRPLSDLRNVRGVQPKRPADLQRLLDESREDP